MSDVQVAPEQKCGFEWHGADGKDHRCSLIACHIANSHECDCGLRKYAGPDPTAWRKGKKACNARA